MTRHRVIITGVALLAMTGFLRAQTKSTTQKTKGSVHVESTRMTGVVDWVQGNTLVAKMQPNGDYRVFIVPPDRQFAIDGQIGTSRLQAWHCSHCDGVDHDAASAAPPDERPQWHRRMVQATTSS